MTTLPQLTAGTPNLPCRTTTDLWFSDYPLDRHDAARQCGPCPLLLACRSYAVETRQEWGVWGGHDFTIVETHCGTERGHRIHVRNGEMPCGPCTRAHAALVEGRRRRRLEVEHAKGGTVRGYEIHLQLGESACAGCLEARRAQSAAARRARAGRGLQRARTPSGSSGPGDAPRGRQTGAHGLPIAS